MEVGSNAFPEGSRMMGIPVVREYKYLGSWVSANTKEVVNRAVKSVRRFGGMIAGRVKQLSPEISTRALSAFVIGKLTYELMPLHIAGTLKAGQI